MTNPMVDTLSARLLPVEDDSGWVLCGHVMRWSHPGECVDPPLWTWLGPRHVACLVSAEDRAGIAEDIGIARTQDAAEVETT